jgi:hypothetical protein
MAPHKTSLAELTNFNHAWPPLGALFLVLIGNALFMHFCAFRGFYLFDFGLFIDGAWRVYRGQQVYVDFYYFTGPFHLYMLAIFFHLFGFGKIAILAHLIVVGSLAIMATFFTTARKLPMLPVILLTVLSATCYYTNRPHPWYDQSAHLWGIFGIWALTTSLPFQKSKRAFWVGFICGAMAILALMTKTNIGLAYGLVFLIVLLVGAERLYSIKGYVIGVIISFILTLLATGAPHGYFENLRQTLSAEHQNRFTNLFSISVWFKNYYWIPALIVLGNVLAAKRESVKRFVSMFVLFFGIAFAGLFSMNTGSEQYPAHLPLMAMYLAAAFIFLGLIKPQRQSKKSFGLNQLSYWALVVFTASEIVFTASFAYARATQNAHPEPELFAYRSSNYEMRTAPFRGWRFNQFDGEVVDLIVDYLNTVVPKEDSFLVLCDLAIIYALTGRDSYRGVPINGLANIDPAPGKQWEDTRTQILNHLPDWLLIKKQDGHLVDELFDYLKLNPILTQYELTKMWGPYGIFKRKK